MRHGAWSLTRSALLLCAIACTGGRPWTPAIATPGDGQSLTHDAAIRIQVLGGNPSQAAVEGALATGADWVAVTGGYGARRRPDWHSEVSELQPAAGRLLAVPQAPQHAWRDSFRAAPSDLSDASWYHVDLAVQGQVWRMVLLDSDPSLDEGLRLTQQSWIPKVVGRGDYDRLIVWMADPAFSVAEPDPGRVETARNLVRIVQTHAPALALTLVVTSGAATHEAHLPEGPFGPLHLVAGNTDQDAVDLPRRAGEMGLVNGFDAALAQLWRALGGPPNPDVWTADRMPLQGTWELILEDDVTVAFWPLEAPQALYRARFTSESGWLGSAP